MSRAARIGWGSLALLAAAAIVQAAAYWPGIMPWDAVRQYGQALSGEFDDWHPPAMEWLWRQFIPLKAGPAPMLVLQMTLYWAGNVPAGGRRGAETEEPPIIFGVTDQQLGRRTRSIGRRAQRCHQRAADPLLLPRGQHRDRADQDEGDFGTGELQRPALERTDQLVPFQRGE